MTLEPALVDTDDPDHHYYCCNPDVALCGTDLTGHPYVDDEVTCLICLAVEDYPCTVTCDVYA